MGKDQLLALAEIIRRQIEEEPGSPLIGTWTIEFNKERQVFYFGKCEFGGYCEERPTVIGIGGDMVDKGGPLLGG